MFECFPLNEVGQKPNKNRKLKGVKKVNKKANHKHETPTNNKMQIPLSINFRINEEELASNSSQPNMLFHCNIKLGQFTKQKNMSKYGQIKDLISSNISFSCLLKSIWMTATIRKEKTHGELQQIPKSMRQLMKFGQYGNFSIQCTTRQIMKEKVHSAEKSAL